MPLASLSTLDAIPERSEATPGLWNSRFSSLNSNFSTLNSLVSMVMQSYDSGGAYYNVRSFGTDVAAFRRAINAAALSGVSRVYVPAGLYSVSSLTLPSNMELFGAGPASVLQMPSGIAADTKQITNADQTNGNRNIIIRDLALDGNRAANGATSGLAGVNFSRVSRCAVHHCQLRGFTQHAIDSSTSNNENEFAFNVIEDYGTGALGFGIVVLQDCHRNRIIGNHIASSRANVGIAIDDISFVATYDGVLSTNNVVEGNTVLGTDFALYCAGSSRNVIQGNTVKSPTNMGIFIASSETLAAEGNVVVGNSIDIDTGVNAYGVFVSGNGAIVSNNQVLRGQVGIVVQDPNYNDKIEQSQNILIEGNSLTSQSLNGIVVTGGQGVVVARNMVLDTNGIGIDINPAFAGTRSNGTVSDIDITDNHIRRPQTLGIRVLSSANTAISGVAIRNNRLVDGSRSASTTYEGISVERGTRACEYVTVVGNRVTSLSTIKWLQAVRLVNSPTTTIVYDNQGIGFNPAAEGGNVPFRAISSTSSLVGTFVVQPSASSFTVVTWSEAQQGDHIVVTPLGAAVSSLSSGLVAHSHCTVAGQIEFRLSNVSTLAQNQSSITWVFTRITPF